MSPNAAPELVRRLLLAVRGDDRPGTDAAAEALARLTEDDLARDLPDDPTRIATWVNLYNAATQRLVDGDPDSYARRVRFFRQPAVTVAGTVLSLDTLEHGLLRRSRPKAGLGYLPNPLAGRFERRFPGDATRSARPLRTQLRRGELSADRGVRR